MPYTLFRQPADFNEVFDGFKFRVVGHDRGIQSLGGGDAEGIGIGERMLAFDFCCGLNQGLIHREKIDRQMFEEAKRIHRLGGTHASLDDVEKFAPVDPTQKRAAASLFLVVKSTLNHLPAGLAVIETHQGKAIENELFAHGAPLPGDRGEDLELRKTGPSKNPWPSEWDQGEPG